ncbi:MAG: RNA methyltransferase [Alphaproteobacteria bacterium]|nr:RNA methyltransferase [Alphaproteobacteria bacterium]
MLPISSAQNPTIKLIRSLSDKKGRREAGLFVAEGLTMLERAEDLGWEPAYLVATKPVRMFDGVKPFIITEKLMAELSAQNNPHDVLGVFPQRWQPHPAKAGNWLALEEIRDPGNLGTIIRTADAASAAGIILVGDCCDPYAAECVRASTGSIFAVPVTRMPQQSFIDFLKAWPGDSVATRMDAKQDFRRPYQAPSLVVMGSEARGLSDSISSACKVKVRIPMKSGVESLNVATAAALLLYQLS